MRVQTAFFALAQDFRWVSLLCCQVSHAARPFPPLQWWNVKDPRNPPCHILRSPVSDPLSSSFVCVFSCSSPHGVSPPLKIVPWKFFLPPPSQLPPFLHVLLPSCFRPCLARRKLELSPSSSRGIAAPACLLQFCFRPIETPPIFCDILLARLFALCRFVALFWTRLFTFCAFVLLYILSWKNHNPPALWVCVFPETFLIRQTTPPPRRRPAFHYPPTTTTEPHTTS